MPAKDFKTYDEQISILVSRGVQIITPEDKSFAKKHCNMKDIIILT